MLISKLVSEVADGPFVLNVSADSSMIIVDKLVDGLTYTFSVCVYVSIYMTCLLYTSPSPRDATLSRMPSSA